MEIDDLITESKRLARNMQEYMFNRMEKYENEQVTFNILDIVKKLEESQEKNIAMSTAMYVVKSSDLFTVERCPDDHTGDTYIFTKR